MKRSFMKLLGTEKIAKDVYKSVFEGDISENTVPGQFVNISIEGLYLRRPISVCDLENSKLTLVYKTVGKGTKILSEAAPGSIFDMLTGLGNGYDTKSSGESPLLIGGGVGVPPLFLLAKKLIDEGKRPSLVMGFGSEKDVFFTDEFASLGISVSLATVDGSAGEKGFVTDILPEDYSYFYTCGPEPMLKAVYMATHGEGEFSLEERMGCGFGACMGCSCKTLTGNKRICKDGPVFKKGELPW